MAIGILIDNVSVLFFKYYLFLSRHCIHMAQNSKDANDCRENPPSHPVPLLPSPLSHRQPILSGKFPLCYYLVALGDKSMNIYFSVSSINALWVHDRVLTNDLQNPGISVITWDRFKYCLGRRRHLQASPSVAQCRIKDSYYCRLHLANMV